MRPSTPKLRTHLKTDGEKAWSSSRAKAYLSKMMVTGSKSTKRRRKRTAKRWRMLMMFRKSQLSKLRLDMSK
jgi:hypothetical protein